MELLWASEQELGETGMKSLILEVSDAIGSVGFQLNMNCKCSIALRISP